MRTSTACKAKFQGRRSLLERKTPRQLSQAYHRDLDGRDVDNFPIAEVHAGLVQQPSDGHLQHRSLELTPQRK